jgi:hypothetical protein
LLTCMLVHVFVHARKVFYIPGNHDLWTRHGPDNGGPAVSSMDRLAQLEGMCARCGVATGPAGVAGQLWVCPLLSWYDRTTRPDALPEECVAPPLPPHHHHRVELRLLRYKPLAFTTRHSQPPSSLTATTTTTTTHPPTTYPPAQ